MVFKYGLFEAFRRLKQEEPVPFDIWKQVEEETQDIAVDAEILVKNRCWISIIDTVESYEDLYRYVFYELVVKYVEKWWRYYETVYEKTSSINMKQQPMNELYRYDMRIFSKFFDNNKLNVDVDDEMLEELDIDAAILRSKTVESFYLVDFMINILLKDMYEHTGLNKINKIQCYDYYMKWLKQINEDNKILKRFDLVKIHFIKNNGKHEMRSERDDRKYYLDFSTKEVFEKIWKKMVQDDNEKETVDLEIAAIMLSLFIFRCNGTQSKSPHIRAISRKIGLFLENKADDAAVIAIFAMVLRLYQCICQRYEKKYSKNSVDDIDNKIFKINGGAIYRLYKDLEITKKIINAELHIIEVRIGEDLERPEVLKEDATFSILELLYAILIQANKGVNFEEQQWMVKAFAKIQGLYSDYFGEDFFKKWKEFCQYGYGINSDLNRFLKKSNIGEDNLTIRENHILPISEKEKQDRIISSIAVDLINDRIVETFNEETSSLFFQKIENQLEKAAATNLFD